MDELLLPAPALRSYVEGYWHRSGNYQPARKVRVVADACTKLIFEFAPVSWPSCYVIVTQLSPIIVMLSGQVDRIGIRFRPGTASFFLGRTFVGLTHRFAALPELGISENENLRCRLRDADNEARAAILDRWLLARSPEVAVDAGELHATLNVARLLRSGLAPPAVATTMEWSERRLQRLCRRRFGASAASLHRLYRFEQLQRRLAGQSADLADLAAELGFADQAHMARDFRHFADTTISAYLRERAAVGNLQDAAGWLPVLRSLKEES